MRRTNLNHREEVKSGQYIIEKTMMDIHSCKKDIATAANSAKAQVMQRFFKTGKGEYGEGDKFLGLTVPQSRQIAKKYVLLSLEEVKRLLESNTHEERLIALLMLVEKFKKEAERKIIFDFYIDNAKCINNWDLVDLSADKIVGWYLQNQDKKILYKLATSQNLWERRIAMISTFHFIKQNEFQDTLKIVEILLTDKHDLIQKAVGWMLREIGKRSLETEENFLKKNYKKMPRTMLRYSIEKFSEEKRLAYLQGRI